MSSPSSSSTCLRACGSSSPPARTRCLPLARLRARGELTELRAADLRFSPDEAADFLGRVMGLELTAEDIAALESRTEGWIAGLQLAALSLQGQKDIAGFIHSFTGSHRFVLDYLVEEVLRHQPEAIQAFLLRTSILDRFCGPLCDALVQGESGQETLEYLERANLFIVPLDGERRWYRYHRLFGELLRQRLEQSLTADKAGDETGAAALHIRASRWYEENGLPIDAFRHAAAAADIDRAERLISSKEMPLHFRGAVIAILDWLASLPASVLDARPSLRVLTATMSLVAGRTTGVEEALQAAEQALPGAEPDEATRDLIGRIAAARATLALTRYQLDAILVQSRRALDYLHPENLPFRCTAMWTMAFAHLLQGDRATAGRAYAELESLSRRLRGRLSHAAGPVQPGGGPGAGQPAPPGRGDLPACPSSPAVTIRSPTRARPISAWLAYRTNGTSWMRRRSMGNGASSSRGSTTVPSTGSSSASSSSPGSRWPGDMSPPRPPGSKSWRPPRGGGASFIACPRSPRCRYRSSCARATWRRPLISPGPSICPRAGRGSSWRGTSHLLPWHCSSR